jgi:hypothetical protein
MADATRYEISHEEILTALIRHLDINEGIWSLNTSFNFEARNVRTSKDDPRENPGFLGYLKQISLTRVSKSIPGLSVDAAKVNPKAHNRRVQ